MKEKTQLLASIREIFQTGRGEHISSKDLLERLIEREDGPWASWWKKDFDSGNTKGPGAKLARMGQAVRHRFADDQGTRRQHSERLFGGILRRSLRLLFTSSLAFPQKRHKVTILYPCGFPAI